MKQDLIGQEFRVRLQGVEGFTVRLHGVFNNALEHMAVQDAVIQQRFTDTDAKTEELHALVTIRLITVTGNGMPVRGVLVVRYKLYEQGWKLQSVESPGYFVTIQENQVETSSATKPIKYTAIQLQNTIMGKTPEDVQNLLGPPMNHKEDQINDVWYYGAEGKDAGPSGCCTKFEVTDAAPTGKRYRAIGVVIDKARGNVVVKVDFYVYTNE